MMERGRESSVDRVGRRAWANRPIGEPFTFLAFSHILQAVGRSGRPLRLGGGMIKRRGLQRSQQPKVYSFYKATEGGQSQRDVLSQLRSEHIPCGPWSSPYVGQTAVVVYGGARVQRKAERIIFGR